MSDFEIGVLALLAFTTNLLTFLIWILIKVNKSIQTLRATTIAASATMQTLMKEHTSELQRARLRAR